jgi:uncharacterized membrane protein
LDQDEEVARPRPRIESLSDLVFGLALSIGAIALIGNPPTTIDGLFSDLLTFAFNFFILISVWLRYTRVMSVLPTENTRTMSLNILLLFSVSCEPFLFNILRAGNSAAQVAKALLSVASSLYGFDLGIMMLVMGIFTVALADEEKKLVPRAMIRELRTEATTWLTSAAIFLVSALPVFDNIAFRGTQVRFGLWFAALVVVWLRRRSTKVGKAREV